MSKGIIIFAYNTRQVDYAKISLISAALAKKNLQVPVSLITDDSTVNWMKESKIYEASRMVFDKIIIDKIEEESFNYRILHDGDISEKILFNNQNRYKAWDLTPYDRTLILDCDYFIFTDTLSNYWDIAEDFMISDGVKDLYPEDRFGYDDRYISNTGVKLFWATSVMFTKNDFTKNIFNYLQYIKENYNEYSEIYRFDKRVYRNDFVFSIANHTFGGFEVSKKANLPRLLTTLDRDILVDVSPDSKLTFLLERPMKDSYIATSIRDTDIHIMNKQSLIRNFEKFVGLT